MTRAHQFLIVPLLAIGLALWTPPSPRTVPVTGAEAKPPTLKESISRLDAAAEEAKREDERLAQLAQANDREADRLRAEQLVNISQQTQLKSMQDRLSPQLNNAKDELGKVLGKIRQLKVGIDDWNKRCADKPLSKQAYEKCKKEQEILDAHATQYTVTRDRWRAEVDTLQAQFDKNQAMLMNLTAEWVARDKRLQELARESEAIRQRRAAIQGNIKRLEEAMQTQASSGTNLFMLDNQSRHMLYLDVDGKRHCVAPPGNTCTTKVTIGDHVFRAQVAALGDPRYIERRFNIGDRKDGYRWTITD